MLTQRFGSLDRLRAHMLGAAKAAGGWGGWSAAPLLVLDVYEHAFAIDYGADEAGFLDVFWRNVGWKVVHERATRALAHG